MRMPHEDLIAVMTRYSPALGKMNRRGRRRWLKKLPKQAMSRLRQQVRQQGEERERNSVRPAQRLKLSTSLQVQQCD